MAEQDGKERLNNNEFRELIPHLPFADLLRIEYRTDKWYKLLSVADSTKKLYGCSLCSITNSNAKNLNAHMEGKKHKLNIQEVKQLFHPEYTYMKHDWKLAAGAVKSLSDTKPQTSKPKINENAASLKPALTNVVGTRTIKGADSPSSAAPKIKPPSTVKISTTHAKVVLTPNPSLKPTVSKTANTNSSLNTNVSKTSNLNSPSKPNLTKTANTTSAIDAVPKKATNQAVLVSKSPCLGKSIGSSVVPIATKNTSVSNTNPKSANQSSANTKTAPSNNKPLATSTVSLTSKNVVLKDATPVKTKSVPKLTITPKSTQASMKTPIQANASNKSGLQDQSDQPKPTQSTQSSTTAKPKSVDDNNQKASKTILTTIKTEPGTAIELNANDPCWNPKVSVKNLNIAKIAKAGESAALQSHPKVSTHIKNGSESKVSLKKGVPSKSNESNTCRTSLENSTSITNKNTIDAKLKVSKTTVVGSVEKKSYSNEANTGNEDAVPKLQDTNNVQSGSDTQPDVIENVEEELNKSELENVSTALKNARSDLNNKTNNTSDQQAQNANNEFSEDVQFDEMSVNFEKNISDSQTNLVKNPFALKKDGSKSAVPKIYCVPVDVLRAPINVDTPKIPDIIVIDDDGPAVEEPATAAYQPIPIIERYAPKPQRQKVIRSITEESPVSLISNQKDNSNKRAVVPHQPESVVIAPKKPKVVVNPAAAFLVEAASNDQSKDTNLDSSDKPKYQTNRVIIPTVHKEKQTPQLNVQKALHFSTKTFSSKPRDDDIHGLVGVEYVVKIMKSKEDISPRYECSLCELILDGPSMQCHLVGYNHRLKFCEKHFPTAIRQFRQYIGNLPQHEVFKVMTPILSKLTVAIEKHHGRDLPYEVLEKDYNSNRLETLSKVFSCRHASELHGPSFSHVLDAKEVDSIIAQKNNFKPQPGPTSQIFNVRSGAVQTTRRERNRQRMDIVKQPSLPSRPHPYSSLPYRQPAPSDYNSGFVQQVDDETHKKMVADFLRGTHQSGSPGDRHRDHRDRQRRSRRSRSRDRLRKRSRSRSKTRQKRESRKSVSPLREGDIWQAYRHMVDRKMNDLNEVFKLYKSDPETHPMYNDEWQKFWKRRKDELIAAGLDHRSYNYQPEWVRFFKVRIEELYSQALENIKVQSRERLCLPMDNNSLKDPKYHVQTVNAYPQPPVINDNTEQRFGTEIAHGQKEKKSEVIPVLRLLTAVEEYLGSLGPKIIDLMSKALSMEKTNPTQINESILTVDNCTLLETAMEKLRGVLFAGLLEGTKERAFKKVIADTEQLLAFAEQERKRNPPKVLRQMPVAPPIPVPAPDLEIPTALQTSSISGVTLQQQSLSREPGSAISSLLAQVDKKELAAKLAATLTAQGKTDFNPEQLEQLIAVYTVIEKKKREAASVATTAKTATVNDVAPSASLSNRKTLSDTLVDFMNPSNPNASSAAISGSVPEDSSAKQSYTAATINRYLDVMRRTGGVFPNSGVGGKTANEIWQNLQNIQRGMGRNTNATDCIEPQSIVGSQNSGFSGATPFNQFGINSISSNDFNNAPGANLNSFVGGLGSNQSGLLPFQQKNPYIANQSAPYGGASATMFTNTNNNSRVSSNNISISTQQSQQLPRQEIPNLQSRPTQFQGQNPNNNWAPITGAKFVGKNKKRNQRGGEGGLPRQITGVDGKQQKWRNN